MEQAELPERQQPDQAALEMEGLGMGVPESGLSAIQRETLELLEWPRLAEIGRAHV